MKSIIVYYLLDKFKGFKDRKREIGLSSISLNDLATAILEEITAIKSDEKAVVLGARSGDNKKKNNKKKDKEKPKLGKDYIELIYRMYKECRSKDY
jgi:hypothetical protein